MKTSTILSAAAILSAATAILPTSSAFAAKLQVSADRIAADRVTGSLLASGNVVAVSAPYRLLSDSCTKNAENVSHFSYPSMFTTCTNDLCCLHWSITGEAEYAEGHYVSMRNATLRFFGLPIFWLPYFKYPLDGECGWRVMPGWNSEWGAFLLNKYVYNIAGDDSHEEGSWYLHGNTRLDWRYENGVALGQTLYWQLGDAGRGKFKVYYAWDADHDKYSCNWDNGSHWNYRHWGSEVPANRYGVELEHRWEPTERDTVRIHGQLFSDSHFRSDFMREGEFLTLRNDWNGYIGNELAWEHYESWFGAGVSVSGPLNEFVGGTCRLPEFYFDVAPTPVWSSPVNYESSSRIGFLNRQAARYGSGSVENAYSWNPGEWANYRAIRFDTYHRFTAPFKLWDALSVVPRLAYRGTYWSETGESNYTGWGHAGKTGEQTFRSIFESGVTFAGRGTAWLDDRWQHVIEPYADVLAQGAWFGGLSDGNRPYIFDSLDGSTDWFDQFAGRGRNLPYSYCGVTPGVRNVLREADEKGVLRTVLDVDAYVAMQFNRADLKGSGVHALAEPDSPNCGDDGLGLVPGARVRWFPAPEMMLGARLEYDVENSRIAVGDIQWTHRINQAFSYHASFQHREFRLWDFSSSPYDRETMTGDEFNTLHFSNFLVGFEHEVCDAFAWSPYLRWDCREGDLDEVGTWFDIRTDCLGFRFIVSYENAYTRIDRSEYREDWNVGFYIYLRAFGANSGALFGD